MPHVSWPSFIHETEKKSNNMQTLQMLPFVAQCKMRIALCSGTDRKWLLLSRAQSKYLSQKAIRNKNQADEVVDFL